MTTEDNNTTQIDPVTLAVIRGQLNQIVNEMDKVLVNSAFSPIICDANDMATGIYRPNGGTVAQGDLGLPIFVGNMEFLVTHIAEEFAGDIGEGDIFITNDPYIGGTHLNDVKLVKPHFEEGELVAFVANTGHWVDIGGAVAGGFGITREIYQDGLRIPPVKLYDGGELSDDLLETVFTNIRSADNVRGDYKAQLNSINAGEQRFQELLDDYGLETIEAAIVELEERSESQMRSRLESIPDGVYEFTDYIDNDGVVDEPLPISLTMTAEDDELVLDFEGSARPCQGPLNVADSCTVSACNIAFKHLYPDIPINAGCFKPFEFHIPDDSFLNAEPPKPTAGYTETSQRVLDTVMGAFGKAIPDDVPAQAFSTSAAVPMSGHKDGVPFTTIYAMSGGYGGSKNQDGLNYCTTPYGRARMPNVEIMESRSPLLFREKRLRPDSGGPGRNRGGLGAVYDIEMLADEAKVGFLGDRGDHFPSGVAGGESAAGAVLYFVRSGEKYVPPFRTKAQEVELTEGDTLHMESPGGGGHGSPLEREAERVLHDVEYGYITPEHAEEAYGIIVTEQDGSFELNESATRELRSQS